ncbi:MAG: regulatory role in alginate production, membrane protein, partial [Marinobacter sp. T13-3]
GSHQGHRVGLSNTRSRLTAVFGDTAVLKQSRHNGTHTVTLRLPRQNLRQDSGHHGQEVKHHG